MGQVKVYAHFARLRRENIERLSNAIHRATVGVLGLPENKRFHRFIPLAAGQFIHPDDRSECYTIVEVNLIAGRSAETKRAYLRALIANIHTQCDTPLEDIEIALVEIPRANWGIRGVPADELQLTYRVET